MFEYAGNEIVKYHPDLEGFLWEDNHVGIKATMQLPDDGPEASSLLLGGASATVGTGRTVRFMRFEADPGGTFGVFIEGEHHGAIARADFLGKKTYADAESEILVLR